MQLKNNNFNRYYYENSSFVLRVWKQNFIYRCYFVDFKNKSFQSYLPIILLSIGVRLQKMNPHLI